MIVVLISLLAYFISLQSRLVSGYFWVSSAGDRGGYSVRLSWISMNTNPGGGKTSNSADNINAGLI